MRKSAKLCLKMGQFLMRETDYQLAVNTFTKGIELEPDYFAYYDYRGMAHGELHEYEEAIKDFTNALELNGDYAGAYNNRGLSNYKLRRMDEAMYSEKEFAITRKFTKYVYGAGCPDFASITDRDGAEENAERFPRRPIGNIS